MQILIVDDDATSRLILRTAVERLGHCCRIAVDGSQAWEIFQDEPYDVVISDWMMPKVSGIELCQCIRNTPGIVYPYFIFLTALGDYAHLLEGINAGADDYLSKPLISKELELRLVVAERITGLHRILAEQAHTLKELNEQLFAQGRLDNLTGMGNRLRLSEDLEILTAEQDRYDHNYTAVLCDVDHFKRYNDLYGHLAGDAVLRQIAAALRQTARRSDRIYRYGGEEFLIIMPEQTSQTAKLAAERLRSAIAQLAIPHEQNEPMGVVTLSVGVATRPPRSAKSIDEWLHAADEALYRAKRGGRNRTVTDDLC